MRFPLRASAIKVDTPRNSRTLKTIAEFAEAQVDKARFIRVMNSVGDGNKIREFRERLGQAMNRFEVGGYYYYYS